MQCFFSYRPRLRKFVVVDKTKAATTTDMTDDDDNENTFSYFDKYLTDLSTYLASRHSYSQIPSEIPVQWQPHL